MTQATRVWKGHTDFVRCACAIGDAIVSGSSDMTVRIWNATSGTCDRTLNGHTDSVNCVCAIGDAIVSGSWDTTVRIWNAATGTLTRTLEGHTGSVFCVCAHGDKIVSGSRDSTLRIWKATTGTCVRTLTGHTDWVTCVCAHGGKIVSGSDDNTLRVWNAATGTCVRTLEGNTDIVWCVCAIGDAIVSGSADNTLRVWTLPSVPPRKKRKQPSTSAPACAAPSPLIDISTQTETTLLQQIQNLQEVPSGQLETISVPVLEILASKLKDAIQNVNELENQCSICLDPVGSNGGSAVVLHKNNATDAHRFCYECITGWQKRGETTCPRCRMDIQNVLKVT